MKNIPTNKLKEDRAALINEITTIGDKILRGSLFEKYKPCGKKGCKCAKGKGHGPKYYLTVNFPKTQPQQDYIPKGYVAQVKGYLSNYQKMKETMERICMINREILKRREKL
jgi:hypothetical protein